MLFSERYADLIAYGIGETRDDICGEISYRTKQRLSDVMREFAEPQIDHPNRYDNWEVRTTALESAIGRLNDHLGFNCVYTREVLYPTMTTTDYLAATFSPYLFDIIELQYDELTDSEKHDYQDSINEVFENDNIPWLLHQGRLIKIDAQQFEMDLRHKSLIKLSELKDADSKFSPAYQELVKAYEFFEKKEYGETINSAGKSYESILKVVCSEQRGNADKLTNMWCSAFSYMLPSTMTASGFREKVLMSLPFIRNNSGAAHGTGEEEAVISKEIAQLSINLAAALDTYLVEEYKKSLKAEDRTI